MSLNALFVQVYMSFGLIKNQWQLNEPTKQWKLSFLNLIMHGKTQIHLTGLITRVCFENGTQLIYSFYTDGTQSVRISVYYPYPFVDGTQFIISNTTRLHAKATVSSLSLEGPTWVKFRTLYSKYVWNI